MNGNEASSVILYAADEPTAVANLQIIEQYMEKWGNDFPFFAAQVVGMLVNSLETDDLLRLLESADKNTVEHLPALELAKAMMRKGTVQ